MSSIFGLLSRIQEEVGNVSSFHTRNMLIVPLLCRPLRRGEDTYFHQGKAYLVTPPRQVVPY
jgi:hypothetical protein